MEMIPLPRLVFLRGVFLANHLAGIDNLTRTTKRQNSYQQKLTIHKRGHNKQQHNRKTCSYIKQKTWFSHLLRHPARKQNRSILTTPEPTRGPETILSEKKRPSEFNVIHSTVEQPSRAYQDSNDFYWCTGPMGTI